MRDRKSTAAKYKGTNQYNNNMLFYNIITIILEKLLLDNYNF